MSKRLQILGLSKESFKEFGEVIATEGRTPVAGDDNFNWFEGLGVYEGMDNVSVNILECKQRQMKIDKLESHLRTPEAIIPMGGVDVIAVVAPAGELDESRMKAFLIPGDKGVVLNSGVRHFIPYPLVGNANCIIVFRHGTGANDMLVEQLSDDYQLVR